MIHPIDRPSKRKKKAKFGKFPKFLLVLLLIVGILGYFLAYLPYTRIKAKGMVLVASAKEMKAILAQNDIEDVKS
jgi:hypothetical protein